MHEPTPPRAKRPSSVLRPFAAVCLGLLLMGLQACTPRERTPQPLGGPPSGVSTTLALEARLPRVTMPQQTQIDVQIVNLGAESVSWEAVAPPGVTVTPASSPSLGPSAREPVTIAVVDGATPGTVVVDIDGGDGSRASLGIEIVVAGSSPTSPSSDLEIGTPLLDLEHNSVAEIAVVNSDDEPADLTIESSSGAEGDIALEGATSRTIPARDYDVARFYVVRGPSSATGDIEGLQVFDTPGVRRPVRLSYSVAETTTPDACDGSAVLTASMSIAPGDASENSEPTPTGAFVAGQVVVGFDDTRLSPKERRGLARGLGLDLLQGGDRGPSALLRIPSGADPRAVAARLARDPRIAYAEPNFVLDRQFVPSDPDIGQQWALCRFGAPRAWSTETGDPSVVVAIIDDGIDLDHPDLVGNLAPGIDLCPVATGRCPEDDGGLPPYDLDPSTASIHGTHVAGIAAAEGNNGTVEGTAGVAWGGTRILPVKVFNGAGANATSYAVANAIRWAAGLDVEGLPKNANPADVINLSLGGCDGTPDDGCGRSEVMEFAAEDATAAGAFVVAAAGNLGTLGACTLAHRCILFPANAPSIVSVGSVDSNRQRSTFSLFDVTGGPSVELMAPGGTLIHVPTGPRPSAIDILSTIPDDGYAYLEGTSMASPYVAGVAALMKSADPSLTPQQIRSRLRDRAYLDPSWDEAEYGYGLACPDAALGLDTTCGSPN